MEAEGKREPRMGEPGFFPNRLEALRAEYKRTTPEQRVSEAIALSRFATRLAVLGRRT